MPIDDIDAQCLSDQQLEDWVTVYDQLASSLHQVLSLQTIPGQVDYCALEASLPTDLEAIAPAVKEWERRLSKAQEKS